MVTNVPKAIAERDAADNKIEILDMRVSILKDHLKDAMDQLADAKRMVGNVRAQHTMLFKAAANPSTASKQSQSNCHRLCGHESYDIAEDDNSEDEYHDSGEDDWLSQ